MALTNGVLGSYSLTNNSLKQITLTSCFQTCTLPTKDVEFTVKFQLQAGLQCGLVFGLGDDYNNLGILYCDGSGSVVLDIFESGTTWTQKAKTAIAYSADKPLVLRRDGTELACYYNDTLVGAAFPTTNLSAGENTNLSGLKVGLFSTGAENSFSAATVFYTGSGGELSILDRILGA